MAWAYLLTYVFENLTHTFGCKLIILCNFCATIDWPGDTNSWRPYIFAKATPLALLEGDMPRSEQQSRLLVFTWNCIRARPLIITFFPLIWRSQDLHLDATSSRPPPQLPGQRCKECAVISQLKNIWKIFTIHRAHSTLNLLLKISPPLCVICEQKCVVLGGFYIKSTVTIGG